MKIPPVSAFRTTDIRPKSLLVSPTDNLPPIFQQRTPGPHTLNLTRRHGSVMHREPRNKAGWLDFTKISKTTLRQKSFHVDHTSRKSAMSSPLGAVPSHIDQPTRAIEHQGTDKKSLFLRNEQILRKLKFRQNQDKRH